MRSSGRPGFTKDYSRNRPLRALWRRTKAAYVSTPRLKSLVANEKRGTRNGHRTTADVPLSDREPPNQDGATGTGGPVRASIVQHLLHGNSDRLGHDRRRVRRMLPITQQQLNRVSALG
jgi:hypothetical protein